MSQVALVPLVIVLAAGLVAAVTDVWRFKVYNILTFPLLFSGIAYHALQPGRRGVRPGDPVAPVHAGGHGGR